MKQRARAIFSLQAMWKHVLIPLAVLTLYFVSFSFFLSWLLPEYAINVNFVFVNRAWKYSLLLAIVLYLLFFVLFKITKGNRITFGDNIEKIGISDLILLLLPLTPVVQYILNNQDILSPLGSVHVLAVFVGFSVLFVIVIPALLGIIGSTKTLMLLGMSFTFMITYMASLSAKFSWLETGSLTIQLGILSAIFVGGRLLYSHQISRKFMYIFIVIFFITGIALQLTPAGWGKTMPASINQEVEDNKLVELVGSRTPASTPNIYLLLYDAYVTNETMVGYGIDNSAQEEYLKSLGFALYPHTYSVGGGSFETMSRLLNASTAYYSNTRKGVSGDGVVHNLLKSFGYITYGIFQNDYFFQGIGSSYDFTFPKPDASSSHKLLIKAIFMGEFRFDVNFDKPSREEFVECIISTFKNIPNKPRFVYMHALVPSHSLVSGICRPNEIALFKERLSVANKQMKEDVEAIIQNDTDAVIIVAGDHGPYLTKNCAFTSWNDAYDISEISRLDIQDRLGTFLAIKWPSTDYSGYDDITVLQDIFPAVFAYLFKDNSLLEAKVAPDTLEENRVSGASVRNGIIFGGINDGEPLFVNP